MKARFLYFKPYGQEGEPKEYIELDPTDDRRNTSVREATDSDRTRWKKEYEEFQKNADEERQKGTQTAQQLYQSMPPSVRASIPMGQEDRVLETFARQTAQTPTEPIPAMTGVAPDQVMRAQRMQAAQQEQQQQQQAQGEQPTATTATAGPAATAESEPDTGTLEQMNAQEAVQQVNQTSDRTTLERWRDAEEDGKNRVTVLDAIDRKLATL